MDRDEVRRRLAARVAATSVEQVAREAGVATMTLHRFVAGDVDQPREPAWSRMATLAGGASGVTAAEAAGVLAAVRRLRLALDQLEHEARSVAGDLRAEILEAADGPLEAATPRRGTRRRAANGG